MSSIAGYVEVTNDDKLGVEQLELIQQISQLIRDDLNTQTTSVDT